MPRKITDDSFIAFLASPLCLFLCAICHAAPSDDASWAEAARERYWRMLAENAAYLFNLKPLRDDPDSAPAGISVSGVWPFDGLAPRPQAIATPTAARTRPVASIEWRRSKDGSMTECFATGSPALLEMTRRVRPDCSPRVAAGEQAPDPLAFVWQRSDDVPSTFDPKCATESAPWSAGNTRASWCSAWVDCYPLGPEGMYLFLAVNLHHEKIVATVTGLGDGASTLQFGPFDLAETARPGITGGALLLAADLDSNGCLDYCFAEYYCSCGICVCGSRGFFVLSDGDRREARFSQYGAHGVALIDHDRNGRAELLSMHFRPCEHCTDGKPHNFWVTNLLGFQNLELVDLREVDRIRHGSFVGSFPAFEWLSYNPQSRFRPLLTVAQKADLGDSGFPLYRRMPKKRVAQTRQSE